MSSTRAAALLAALLSASLAARAQVVPAVGQQQRYAPPLQPLPYSHRQHLALPARLECRQCHVNPAAGNLMTYPATETCLSCHKDIPTNRPPLQQLAAMAASGKPIPWRRVYQLPDYVYWQHGSHLKAGVACAECHGSVPERDVIVVETEITSMKGCVACHDARQVFVDCGDCHEPRQ